MSKVICDTGVVSRYLLEVEEIVTVINDSIGLQNVSITPLNKIELYNWISGYSKLDKQKRAKFIRFINAIPVIHFNEKISKETLILSKKHINSKPADTIIAAIAIYHGIPIYTLNTKDFKTLKAPLY
jgi:predicted nucleic acid-binding protein